jgi:hypothetical protein
MSKKEKTKSIPTIDELLQTKNKHYNEYAKKLITECISKQIFVEAEIALQKYVECLDVLICTDTPFEAIKNVCTSLFRELSAKQCYFILKCLADFINPDNTTFNDWKLQQETYDIMKSHIVRLEKEFAKNQLKIDDIRETLKTLMQNEISDLPQRLEALDNEKRIGIICKLIPYVFPKIETVEVSQGEYKQWYED